MLTYWNNSFNIALCKILLFLLVLRLNPVKVHVIQQLPQPEIQAVAQSVAHPPARQSQDVMTAWIKLGMSGVREEG